MHFRCIYFYHLHFPLGAKKRKMWNAETFLTIKQNSSLACICIYIFKNDTDSKQKMEYILEVKKQHSSMLKWQEQKEHSKHCSKNKKKIYIFASKQKPKSIKTEKSYSHSHSPP